MRVGQVHECTTNKYTGKNRMCVHNLRPFRSFFYVLFVQAEACIHSHTEAAANNSFILS